MCVGYVICDLNMCRLTYRPRGSVTYRFCPRETSYGRWGGGGGGGGLAPVTFLGEKSWKISIV